ARARAPIKVQSHVIANYRSRSCAHKSAIGASRPAAPHPPVTVPGGSRPSAYVVATPPLLSQQGMRPAQLRGRLQSPLRRSSVYHITDYHGQQWYRLRPLKNARGIGFATKRGRDLCVYKE